MNGFFLTVCLNPTLQKTICLDAFVEDDVNRSTEHYIDASGKGINVSRVLTQLGERVMHLSHAGGRNSGFFLDLAKHEGFDIEAPESGSEIRFCYTLLSKSKHTTTEIVEEAASIGIRTEDAIFSKYLEMLPRAHTVVISGTKAPGYSDSIFPKMVGEAKKSGRIVILDIRGKDLIRSLPFHPDIIKPNKSEFVATFFKGAVPADEDVHESMLDVSRTFGTEVVLTSGRSKVAFTDQGKLMRMSPRTIVPRNTTGSGDAFCAGFARSFSRDRNMEHSIEAGMECGTLNALCIRPGSIRL